MTIRRMALQAATANLTQNQAITVDSNGLLISAGLLVYAMIQNVSATDKVLGRVSAGAGSIEEIACTAAGRALIDDADAAAQRTTLGIPLNNIQITGGSITGITDLAIADGGTGSSTAAAARLALGVVDANDRMPTAMHPSRELSHYFHASWDEVIQVAGTWTTFVNASQTDYDSSLIAGYIQNNATHANNDEVHFGSLTLNAGTYKISVAYVKANDAGIIEILLGTTSLGTIDSYAAGTSFNQATTLTYSPTARVSGNLRLKVTNKNASSSNYYLYVSRIEIIRTA